MYDSIVNLSEIFVKLADEATAVTHEVEPYDLSMFSPEAAAALTKRFSEFDLEKLKQIDDPFETIQYCEKNLRRIGSGQEISTGRLEGQGSGRLVYDLSEHIPGTVLKAAISHSGIAQNNNEARIAGSNPLLAEVVDMHPRALWIVSEKIEPFNRDKFFRVTGIPLAEMNQDPEVKKVFDRWTPEGLEYLKSKYNLDDKAIEFLKEMAKIVSNLKVIRGDLTDPVHWGFGQDGGVKLYDYGLDSTMHQTFHDESGAPRDQEYYAKMRQVEALTKLFKKMLR